MCLCVFMLQVIRCKYPSDVCAARWSLAENALLVLSRYEIHTDTLLCSTATVSLLVFCVVCCWSFNLGYLGTISFARQTRYFYRAVVDYPVHNVLLWFHHKCKNVVCEVKLVRIDLWGDTNSKVILRTSIFVFWPTVDTSVVKMGHADLLSDT